MFIIIWEYLVPESHKNEFKKLYGSEGDWAQLFKSGSGYLGTDLLRDLEDPTHYITIDRWISSSAFDSFHEQFRLDYEAIDARCEHLTERETQLGRYNLIST
jgi:heme-degrading monooxygenase HmoA